MASAKIASAAEPVNTGGFARPPGDLQSPPDQIVKSNSFIGEGYPGKSQVETLAYTGEHRL
jgi:hypothetical protein